MVCTILCDCAYTYEHSDQTTHTENTQWLEIGIMTCWNSRCLDSSHIHFRLYSWLDLKKIWMWLDSTRNDLWLEHSDLTGRRMIEKMLGYRDIFVGNLSSARTFLRVIYYTVNRLEWVLVVQVSKARGFKWLSLKHGFITDKEIPIYAIGLCFDNFLPFSSKISG